MYTHLSKCKNDKFFKKLKEKTHYKEELVEWLKV
jgi:hypothetical protein